MTADRLIRSALSEHTRWWAEMGSFFDGDGKEGLAVVACASASSVGLAVALAWVEREFPGRGDELAAVVRHYVDNGGDDEALLGQFRSDPEVAS